MKRNTENRSNEGESKDKERAGDRFKEWIHSKKVKRRCMELKKERL